MVLNRLTADQVARFKIDGFLVVEDLLSTEEVERSSARFRAAYKVRSAKLP